MMHQKYVKARRTVGTRLYRVRHLWVGGPGLMNHGRDTIVSLPFYAYYKY